MTDNAAMTALLEAVREYAYKAAANPKATHAEGSALYEAVRQAAIAYGDQRVYETILLISIFGWSEEKAATWLAEAEAKLGAAEDQDER